MLFPLFARRRCWARSEFPRLPLPDSASDPAHRDYLLLAAGLARLLVRCSPQGAQREFGAALQAYRALRVQLQRSPRVRLPAQVLNDLSHEIALHADRATRDAALRCLRRQAPAPGRREMHFA